MRPRRLLVMLLLLLTGGALVNIAAAWGIAFYIYSGDLQPGDFIGWADDSTLIEGRRWGFASKTGFGYRRLQAGVSDSRPKPDDIQVSLPWWSDLPVHMRRLSMQSATDQPAAARPLRSFPVALAEDVRGWPCYALRCVWDYGTTHSPPLQALINGWAMEPYEPNSPGGISPFKQRAIPYESLWPGFAVNTVFYAAILWGVFAAPFALRRRIRIKRGLCPACAYPVGESAVCTECGRSVQPRRGVGM